MSKNIPKPIDDLIEKADALRVYSFALNHRHEKFILDPKQELIKEKGLEDAIAYVKTTEGRDDYGKRGADKLNEIFFEEFDVDKSNYSKSELETLTNNLYGMNKKNISEAVAKHGLELDFKKYKEEFLDTHMNQINSYVIKNHLLNYDAKHNPAIIDHIFDKDHKTYFKEGLIDELKQDHSKEFVIHAFNLWNMKDRAEPLGVADLKQAGFEAYLKNEYLK